MARIPKRPENIERPAEVDFALACENAGLHIEGAVVPDVLQRVSVEGDSRFKKSGWYVFYNDPEFPCGVFGSWKDGGESHKWASRSVESLNSEALENYRKRVADAKLLADREKAKANSQAADKASKEVDRFQEAAFDHPYLTTKKIKPHGAKQSSGKLVIPMITADGDVVSYQTIDKSGNKKFLFGGVKLSTMYPMGDFSGSTVYVAEGFATAATIREATGATTVACWDSSNIDPICRALTEKYPEKKIVFCGDDDRFPNGKPNWRNVGREKAEQAALEFDNVVAIFPEFSSDEGKPTDFNDLHAREGLHMVAKQVLGEPDVITANAVTESFFSDIPPRQWLYGDHLVRGFVSLTLAPGGVGKTQLALLDALSMITNEQYTYCYPHEKSLNCWHYNLEDDLNELKRRTLGLMQDHNIKPKDIAGRLFLNSGTDTMRCVVAERRPDGTVIQRPDVDQMIKTIKANNISYVSIDPFVKSHYVDENSNKEIDIVVDAYKRIADECDCAIELIHHISKPPRGFSIAGDVNAGRGASALAGAVRAARTVVNMSHEEASDLGIPEDECKYYIRIDNAKNNMSAPSTKAKWMKWKSIELPNKDNIGVLNEWKPASAEEVLKRISPSKMTDIINIIGTPTKNGSRYTVMPTGTLWGGNPIMEMVGLTRAEAKMVLERWIDEEIIYEDGYGDPTKKRSGIYSNLDKLGEYKLQVKWPPE